jgi:hypothetical protein
MDIFKIITATLVATTCMTAFSYFVSEAFNKLYKEPVLLKYLMDLLKIKLSDTTESLIAWITHYVIGLLFVLGYDLMVKKYGIDINWTNSIIYGAIIGIIGIIGWMIMFSLPSEKPKVHFKEYYFQLFIAHLIFGLGVTAVYKIF